MQDTLREILDADARACQGLLSTEPRDMPNDVFAQHMRLRRGKTCTHPAACCELRTLLADVVGGVTQAVTCMACGAETTEFDSTTPGAPGWPVPVWPISRTG